MSIDLAAARQILVDVLGDLAHLVKASASGRRRGAPANPWRRIELRPVEVGGRRCLQVVRFDATQAHTSNLAVGDAAFGEALAALTDEPFATWHLRTTGEEIQLRATKKGAVVHRRAQPSAAIDVSHDRAKERLLDPGAPVFAALGITDAHGRIKPSRWDKYRQVEEFLRALAVAVDDATRSGALRVPTDAEPWQVVDLGCGNGYLTFAAQAWLAQSGLPAVVTGVDVKAQSRAHNEALADRLGVGSSMRFVAGTITEAPLPAQVDIALALHACDTATDDALACAARAGASVILAAPCCHHDLARQLRGTRAPAGFEPLLGDGILRERFADTLTDALRASLLRAEGYRVDVIDFVDSAHTPRNTLLRCVRRVSNGGGEATRAAQQAAAMAAAWSVRPALADLLAQP